MPDKCIISIGPFGGFAGKDGVGLNRYIKQDGTVDQTMLWAMAKWCSNRGANHWHEFCYWKDANGRMISIHSDQFYINHKIIADIVNACGMTYYVNLFEHCGMKGEFAQYSEWLPYGSFYTEASKPLRHRYLDKMHDALKGNVVLWSVCNEPAKGCGAMIADTIEYLVKKGITPEQIEIGIDYREKELGILDSDYMLVRETIQKNLDTRWDQWLKDRCLSPIHNCTIQNCRELLKDYKQKGTRKKIFSADGIKPRIGKDAWVEICRYIYATMAEECRDGLIGFEAMLPKLLGEEYSYTGLDGIVQEYINFHRVNPVNMGRFPDATWPWPQDSDTVQTPVPVETPIERIERLSSAHEAAIEELKQTVRDFMSEYKDHRHSGFFGGGKIK